VIEPIGWEGGDMLKLPANGVNAFPCQSQLEFNNHLFVSLLAFCSDF
jgi:hypothetical protein